MEANICRQKYNKKQNTCILSKYLPTKYFIIIKQKPNLMILTLVKFPVNITSNETYKCHAPFNMMDYEKHRSTSMVYLQKIQLKYKLKNDEISDKPKQGTRYEITAHYSSEVPRT